jgi:hypothetical protein
MSAPYRAVTNANFTNRSYGSDGVSGVPLGSAGADADVAAVGCGAATVCPDVSGVTAAC